MPNLAVLIGPPGCHFSCPLQLRCSSIGIVIFSVGPPSCHFGSSSSRFNFTRPTVPLQYRYSRLSLQPLIVALLRHHMVAFIPAQIHSSVTKVSLSLRLSCIRPSFRCAEDIQTVTFTVLWIHSSNTLAFHNCALAPSYHSFAPPQLHPTATYASCRFGHSFLLDGKNYYSFCITTYMDSK